MSKSSDGIVLAPIKGSDLIKQHKDALSQGTVEVVEAKSTYTLPSKRSEEEKKIPKSLTADQLSSENNFPSLVGAKPMTKSASWGKLRARLCTPTSDPSASQQEATMKDVIDASLKEKEACDEETQRNEATTDPFLMSKAMLDKNGWARLEIKMKNRHEWFANSSYARDPVMSTDDLFI